MKYIWNNIKLGLLWLYTSLHLLMIRISIGLYNAEVETLKADPNVLNEKNNQNQRVRHKNRIAEKMLQGQRDQKFVQDYYEVLKSADKFLRNSTPEQMEMAANKWGMSVGKTDEEFKNVGRKQNEKPKKDKWGRRYDHFGFYDPKNKNYGKTMGEVMVEEIHERTTNDDNKYPIEFMFSNKPPNIGIGNNHEVVEDLSLGFRELNSYEKSKLRKYPLTVKRKNEECFNKIEQLAEYVHIKRVDDSHKILEFFIPAKYKVFTYSEKSSIFEELIDIDLVWIKDEYDNRYGYKIGSYYKRSEILDESIPKDKDQVIYHVVKLRGTKIEKIG